MNIEWKQYRIGEVADVTSSKRIFLSDYVLEGIPFYRSKEVIEKFNGNEISLELFIKSEQYENIKRKFGVPQKDDILLTSVGTIGVPYKVKQNEVFYFKDGNLTWIRKYKKEIDPAFLFQWIRSEIGQKTIQQNLIGSSQSALTIADIKKLKIQLPPLPTQQRIASILSAYDDLIEVNNHRIKLLEETARGLYKEWFVRLRFPGYKKAKFVKGVPEGIGEVKYFKDFIKLNRGFDLPEEKIKEGNYPVIASTSIKGYHNQFKVKGPIITTGRSGTLGTVLFVNQDGWPLNTSLYVKDFKGNEPLYVYYTLKLLDFESFNSGAGVPTLNQNHLHKLKMWVADESLQKKFKLMVEPMFQKVEILRQQNTQLRQIRDRLLPRLISGKLEVKDK